MSAPTVYDRGDDVILRFVWTTLETRGAIQAGATALLVEDPAGYAQDDPILVEGAGPLGSDLVTTVAAIAGHTITLEAEADTSVGRAEVGKLTNPTGPAGKVLKPNGTTATVVVAAVSVGIWEGTFAPDESGEHWYSGTGTGPAKARGERNFLVAEPRVPL